MKQIFDEEVINTKGSGLYDFTDKVHHFVKKNKGKVKIIPLVKGFSSSKIIEKIIKSSD